MTHGITREQWRAAIGRAAVHEVGAATRTLADLLEAFEAWLTDPRKLNAAESPHTADVYEALHELHALVSRRIQ